MLNNQEIIVHDRKVKCVGGEEGHPAVYYLIPHDTNSVTCDYCSLTYKYVEKSEETN